jgi:hypothetical protein
VSVCVTVGPMTSAIAGRAEVARKCSALTAKAYPPLGPAILPQVRQEEIVIRSTSAKWRARKRPQRRRASWSNPVSLHRLTGTAKGSPDTQRSSNSLLDFLFLPLCNGYEVRSVAL